MKYLLMTTVAAFAIASAFDARAAEITLIGPGGIRAAAEQIVAAFEKKTGHKVKATFGSGGGTKDRVIKGEAFDVPIVQPPVAPGDRLGARRRREPEAVHERLRSASP